jgi:hypothetical protein
LKCGEALDLCNKITRLQLLLSWIYVGSACAIYFDNYYRMK